jgi:hypothetical protein
MGYEFTSKLNTPEYFGQIMCQDLQLPFEFQGAIAHQIREHNFCTGQIFNDSRIPFGRFVFLIQLRCQTFDPGILLSTCYIHPISSKMESTTSEKTMKNYSGPTLHNFLRMVEPVKRSRTGCKVGRRVINFA